MASVLNRLTKNKLLQLTLDIIKGETDKDVELRTGLRSATVAKWRSGETKNPTSLSLVFVLNRYGYDVTITKSNALSNIRLVKKAA
jgi:transcriptional regulator with XRE-family HTH domain